MNQILVTEKLYVTPELKRKKHIYKLEFFISIFLICLLFSHYIYAQYEINKGEQVMKELEAQFDYEDEAVISKEENDNIILVFLGKEEEEEHIDEMLDVLPIVEEKPKEETSSLKQKIYTSADGVEYTIESRLKIPKIGLDYKVLSATSPDLLFVSLNKFFGPSPNQIGNYCIAGHYYSSNKMFGYLHKLQNGDRATLTDLTTKNGETVEYEVYYKDVIEPTDVEVTDQRPAWQNGVRELTLMTCTNHGKQRLIVKLREV